jgi:hypothetical protein
MTDLLDCEVVKALPFEERNGILYVTNMEGCTSATKNNMWLETTICGFCGTDLRTTDSPYSSVCPQCGADLPWRAMVTSSC